MAIYSPSTGHTLNTTCHHNDKNIPGVCGKNKLTTGGLLLCPTCDIRTMNTIKRNAK